MDSTLWCHGCNRNSEDVSQQINFMANGIFRTISPSSTFLTYMFVAIFEFHLHRMLISRSWFRMQYSLFDIRSSFDSRQSADKQVNVTGVSTVWFTGSLPQILRSSLTLQPFATPNAVWWVSYRSLSRSWYTDLDYRLTLPVLPGASEAWLELQLHTADPQIIKIFLVTFLILNQCVL
jgi:hypothetical protein